MPHYLLVASATCQGKAMTRIGLTGGIAAGKSVAAARFAELGATVIDHDALARAVVEPGTAGLESIARRFGTQFVVDGRLDRAALGSLVFADQSALKDLNSIVHPLILEESRRRELEARAAGKHVIVHDIPLLIETGQTGHFDLVVCVCAPTDVRLSRLVMGRGLSLEQAKARLAAQADDDVRKAACDVILDGAGRPEQLCEQVDALWFDRIVA